MPDFGISPSTNLTNNYLNSNKSNPSSLGSIPNPASTYSSAVSTQASDYDKIMSQYDNLIGNSGSLTNTQFTPITPQIANYKPSSEIDSSLANLASLTSSGGYSSGDISNIRERGISPIRSIYANAQQNLDRNRSLQGGYSPNYTAATAKMAREMSDIIGTKTTDVNAQIAQDTAKNQLVAAPAYASAAAAESARKNAIEQGNAEIVNRINELNAKLQMEATNTNNANVTANREAALKVAQGKQSLYGTNPALVSQFGNQLNQQQQIAQQNPPIANRGGGVEIRPYSGF